MCKRAEEGEPPEAGRSCPRRGSQTLRSVRVDRAKPGESGVIRVVRWAQFPKEAIASGAGWQPPSRARLHATIRIQHRYHLQRAESHARGRSFDLPTATGHVFSILAWSQAAPLARCTAHSPAPVTRS